MTQQIFATQGDVLKFLHAQGLKIGRTKLSSDYRKGILPCTPDKRFREEDVLTYAESLKAPQNGNCFEKEQLRKSRQLLANLVRKLLPCVSITPHVESMLANWLREAEGLPQEQTLDAVRRAVDTARQRKPSSKFRASGLQKTEILLQGIALGIAAKGKVYRKDSFFLARWIRNHPSLWDKPEIIGLLREAERVNLMFTEDYEQGVSLLQQKLYAFLKSNGLQIPNIKLRGEKRKENNVSVVISAHDLMFDYITEMDFSANFCFTGVFAFASREQCERAVAQLGAIVKRRPVRSGKNYLIVGTASNPQWRGIKGGVKIDDALYYKQSGSDIKIIHEDNWVDLLIKEQRARGIIPPVPVPAGQFRPPWPLQSLYFLMPPLDMDTIQAMLLSEGVEVKDSCKQMVDAVIMPTELCAATEDDLAHIPEIGEAIAADVASARDSGVLMISEEEFRAWCWWPREEDIVLAPTP